MELSMFTGSSGNNPRKWAKMMEASTNKSVGRPDATEPEAAQRAGSECARSEYAELVALRVAKNNPGLVALSYIRSRGSQREQSLDLGVSVVRSKVEMQPILRRLRLRHRYKKKSRKPIGGRSDLELRWVVVHDNPAERVSPPASEGTRVARINDRLLPLEAHESIVETAWPGGLSRAASGPGSQHADLGELVG
jgi:hypothetical protein